MFSKNAKSAQITPKRTEVAILLKGMFESISHAEVSMYL